MDAKTLKKDLIYAIKTFQKSGKTLKVWSEEMEYIDGKYQLVAEEFEPFQALILIKGWQPVPEYLSYLSSMKRTSEAHEEFIRYISMHKTLLFDCDASRVAHLAAAPRVPAVDAPFGYTEWSYTSVLLEREAGLTQAQLSSFQNGFDFAYQYPVDEFYEMGVYMREKFLPADGRKEMLKPSIFVPADDKPMLKKFTLQTRGPLAILEVEGQEVRDVLPPHQISFKIFSPQSLWEKKPSGELVPVIYAPHAIYDSVEEARASCERMIRSGFQFQVRKQKLESFTEEDVQAKLAEVKTVML